MIDRRIPEDRIRAVVAARRAGIPVELLNARNLQPPQVEGVPALPWMGGQPQQIFPAPGDFPPEPQPPARSVLKRGF